MINRKIAFSGLSILAALGMMASATFAVFTSAASNDGNTFGAGTLTLRINGQNPTSTGVFNVSNFAPGNVQTQVLSLNNNGTVDASSVKLTGVDLNTGTLGPALIMRLLLDNGNGIVDGGDTVLAGPAALDNPGWTNNSLGGLVTIPAGQTKQVLVEITFDPTANDTYQGTSENFDLNFQASQ